MFDPSKSRSSRSKCSRWIWLLFIELFAIFYRLKTFK